MGALHRYFALALLATGVWANPLPARPPSALFAVPELAASQAPAGGVEARFMGTSTILLDDGETQILVDGFFTRPGLLRVALGRVRPDHAAVARAMERAGIRYRLRAVLVAHSHYDHALDAPTIARWTGAMLVGSESTANIGRGGGLPEGQILVVGDGDRLRFGRFRVTIFRSPHSPNARFEGMITQPLRPPARVSRYREGGNHAFLIEHDGLRILVHPSANFTTGLYRGVRADVVFLGVGALGNQDDRFAQDYWREVVRATGARLVIPVHWDNFTRSLDHRLRPMPRLADNVRRGIARVREMARRDGRAIGLMPLFEPVDIRAALPPPRPGR